MGSWEIKQATDAQVLLTMHEAASAHPAITREKQAEKILEPAYKHLDCI